jgi:Tfp pilus assembly protein PilF
MSSRSRGAAAQVAWVVLVLGSLCAGCATTRVTVPAFAAREAVPENTPDRGFLIEPYSVEVQSSMSSACKAGVKDLRNEDLEAAAHQLEQAVAKDDHDAYAHFALGLTYEKQGRFDAALEQYKAANRSTDKTNEDYDASRRRAAAKLAYVKAHGPSK